MRLSFQAFSDNLPSFAADAARAIGQHEGPEDLELVRCLALTELKTLRTAEAKDLKGALEQMQKEEIQRLSCRKYFFVRGTFSRQGVDDHRAVECE